MRLRLQLSMNAHLSFSSGHSLWTPHGCAILKGQAYLSSRGAIKYPHAFTPYIFVSFMSLSIRVAGCLRSFFQERANKTTSAQKNIMHNHQKGDGIFNDVNRFPPTSGFLKFSFFTSSRKRIFTRAWYRRPFL